MLKILSFLFGIITISIILCSVNSPYISIYAQDTQYYYKTNENNSSLLNEFKNIKTILESKVTKSATALQIASSSPQILQPPDTNLIDSKINGIPEDVDIEKRKIAKYFWINLTIFHQLIFY